EMLAFLLGQAEPQAAGIHDEVSLGLGWLPEPCCTVSAEDRVRHDGSTRIEASHQTAGGGIIIRKPAQGWFLFRADAPKPIQWCGSIPWRTIPGSRGGLVETETAPQPVGSARQAAKTTAFTVLVALSFSHLLNDLIQSLIPAIYPLLKASFELT